MKERAVKEWPKTQILEACRREDGSVVLIFSTECPNCGNLDSGHKPGCSDLTSCVEYVPVVPQQRVNALVEALEEVQGEIYLWQIGEGPWQGEPTDLIAHLHKVARTALANYKEGEA